ncbi:MAG: exodeoxyribonuclease VII large subunit, partial [Chloroflexota bacterium]
INQRRQRIDDLLRVGHDHLTHHVQLRAERLHGEERGLILLNPLRTLDRGFALVLHESGTIARDGADLARGEALRIRFRDGEIAAVVTETVHPAH